MSDNKNIIRIALIDDHDLLRQGILQLLGGVGFETVFEAENGQSAMQKIAACATLPDLCIVDVNMPVMDGFETTRTLLGRYPQLRILAFSVNDNEKDVLKMLECGANGYILKGADPAELKKAIEIIYNGGCYFSAGVSEIARGYFEQQLQS